jgi:hypothetical protein
MQTFLPYPDFQKSAAVLDDKRLNNQINETTVILRTLLGSYRVGKGWPNHPVTKMWRGYEGCLATYQEACCGEYARRNSQHHTGWYTLQGLEDVYEHLRMPGDAPTWLGDDRVHRSHRSNLLRKLPEHYGQFGWVEPPDLPYMYPAPV